MAKSLKQWLAEYAVSHQNRINKAIHKVCVPVIFITCIGFVYWVSPLAALGVSVFLILFYLRLAIALGIAMAAFLAVLLGVFYAGYNLTWYGWVIVFVVAWIGQFIGHYFEGKKPSFFKDLQFLLIGPAWVVSSIMGNVPPPSDTPTAAS